jgi:hypothetical protein
MGRLSYQDWCDGDRICPICGRNFSVLKGCRYCGNTNLYLTDDEIKKIKDKKRRQGCKFDYL